MPILEGFFTTTQLGYIFPDLKNEVGNNKRLDIRCGFSKNFLEGKLENVKIP
jgi:hypothetical protein